MVHVSLLLKAIRACETTLSIPLGLPMNVLPALKAGYVIPALLDQLWNDCCRYAKRVKLSLARRIPTSSAMILGAQIRARHAEWATLAVADNATFANLGHTPTALQV